MGSGKHSDGRAGIVGAVGGMKFITFDEVIPHFKGKRVAVVGSAPTVLDNEPGFVDSFDVVCRVSDYKLGEKQGRRCDVHYSFYGGSIKKSRDTLMRDGVKLCMCKLPNSKPLKSEWHEVHNKPHGVDYRYIYEFRKAWWPCDVFVPDDARFLKKFNLFGGHQPTTGFAAILDILDCKPRELFVTGYDFFSSKLRNVDEPWKPGDPTDPICHRPDLEAQWIVENADRFKFDKHLSSLVEYMAEA